MPLLKLETTATLSAERRNALLALLSKTLAETIRKPEQYVMVTVNPAAICMSGRPDEAAFVDVRSIGGLDGDVCRKLSETISRLLNEALGIPHDRVYLNFTDVDARHWGWNAKTFG
jgi:phenylpyruvate tautomerase PptA (4-oxalocrotonate tautomerase family)